jgi:hypothetical protein
VRRHGGGGERDEHKGKLLGSAQGEGEIGRGMAGRERRRDGARPVVSGARRTGSSHQGLEDHVGHDGRGAIADTSPDSCPPATVTPAQRQRRRHTGPHRRLLDDVAQPAEPRRAIVCPLGEEGHEGVLNELPMAHAASQLRLGRSILPLPLRGGNRGGQHPRDPESVGRRGGARRHVDVGDPAAVAAGSFHLGPSVAEGKRRLNDGGVGQRLGEVPEMPAGHRVHLLAIETERAGERQQGVE